MRPDTVGCGKLRSAETIANRLAGRVQEVMSPSLTSIEHCLADVVFIALCHPGPRADHPLVVQAGDARCSASTSRIGIRPGTATATRLYSQCYLPDRSGKRLGGALRWLDPQADTQGLTAN